MQIKNYYYCFHISIFYRHDLSYSVTTDIYWGPGESFQLLCLISSENGEGGKQDREIFTPYFHLAMQA